MKHLIVLQIFLISFLWSPMVTANIYTWTDENNVRYFTNQSPPPDAEIFLKEVAPKPTISTEAPDEIKKNDSTAENQELKERLKDTQEKLSETIEKVNILEDKIQNENNDNPQVVEPEESADGESTDRSSYSESENTPKRSTYYYPAGMIRSKHFAKKRHFHLRGSHYRSHKGGYYYKKHKKGKYYNPKRYYKKRYYKKQHIKKYLYKKHRYGNQHHRNRYYGSKPNRSRGLKLHQNSIYLKLK
jgi:hypothetical protein